MQLVDECGETRDGAGEVHDGYADSAGERVSRLVSAIEPPLVCAVLRQALDRSAARRGSVQLTGRFAHETVNRPASEFARLVRAEVLGRGHALRLLLTRSSADEPRLRARLAGLPARTAHVRFSAAPLPDLVSFDRELALVRSAPPDGRPQVLVTRYEATNVLHQFQQVLWDQAAEPPGPGGAARVPELDETQMQVLRMLASGMKDDTACRQMNVSVRTYRRHVATILKSLDVNTRFEAGLAAAELGLLGPRPVRRSAGHPDGRFMPSLLSEGAC